MRPPRTSRHLPRVGQRLFLGLLPALLAVLLAIGLAYYGEYGRTAPTLLVMGAAVLSLVSLLATWMNARYLSARISRLAVGSGPAWAAHGGETEEDDLDRIEHVVDRLGRALTVAEAERQRAQGLAAERLSDQASMLSARVHAALRQLDDVRLPLHILLDAKFGEVNENQEELLGAARDAADAMDAALRGLGQLADVNRGALAMHMEAIHVNDVVRAVLPQARATAERRDARVDVALEPGLPRVRADRARLAEALLILLESLTTKLEPHTALALVTERDEGRVVVSLSPGSRGTTEHGGEGWLLATRLLEAQGGRVERTASGIRVVLG